MTNMEFAQIISDIHNHLTDVSVHGEDVIRMSEILQKCRAIVADLLKQEEDEKAKTKHTK